MTRRLFLTGEIGCGKSAAIRAALGDRLPGCGGLLTVRHREPYLHFTLETPDGRVTGTFLDFSAGKPEADGAVFSRADLSGRVLVLDEIGGIELLNPVFWAALTDVLRRDVPILGVLKAESSSMKLAAALGLTEEYALAAARLREMLSTDADTLVYRCGQYDDNALRLARQWVEEYCHG